MPRIKQYLDYVEDLRSLSIKTFKPNLKPYTTFNNGVITFSRGDQKSGSISYETDISETEGTLTLSYKYRDSESIRYDIDLISKPSNLGNGVLWYFICPKTGKKCRKLHFKDGYFYHKSAFPALYYENQVLSKNWRNVQKSLSMELDETVFENYFRKNRKKTYRGIPTKEEIRLSRLIEEKENYKPSLDILNFLTQ